MDSNKINLPKKETEFDELDKKIQEIELKKSIKLKEFIDSSNPSKIMKAQGYLKKKQDANYDSKPKAFLFSPEKEFRNGLDFKAGLKAVSYELQRGMARTPLIRAIIDTRVEQVLNFSQFTTNLQDEGWTIVKKVGRFGSLKDYKRTPADEKIIDDIATYLENGGRGSKWDKADDFDIFLRKFTIDSLELDQAVFELDKDRLGNLYAHYCVDGATIRLLETIDEEEIKDFKNQYVEKDGMWPVYCQVWNERIVEKVIDGVKEQVIWYPDEMCFAIRNKSTDIRLNGYGTSELEILVEIVTWLLYGFQYNGNFFQQGSNPKGFFTIEGAADSGVLNEFKLAWRNTVMGIANSHKIPVFEGEKINWVNMQTSNKDMEFQKWNEFLILIGCAVYRMDPSELGFHFAEQAQMFGQDGQKERLSHSKNKGLKPILKFEQKQINKYLVSELNDEYLFMFTGIDLDDEQEKVDLDKEKLAAGMVSFESMFQKYEGEKYNPKKHTILNPTFVQAEQMKQYGGDDMNNAVDEESGGKDVGTGNPFDKYKSLQSNPIMRDAMNYIEKSLLKK